MKTLVLAAFLLLPACGGAAPEAGNAQDAASPEAPADPPVPVAADASAGASAAAAKSLCRSGEKVLFQCMVAGGKLVALCAPPDGEAIVHYRFGRPGAVELAHSGGGAEGFRWAQAGYSGGGEAQVSFTREGHEYVVYSRTIRTGFGPDGHNNPKFEDGVFVRKDGRLIADRRCPDAPAGDRLKPLDVSSLRGGLPEGEIIYRD